MNTEQQNAFDAIKKGKNIFLTGPAGTGKSFVINEVKQWANQSNKKYGITALTGCAAVLIGGRTLHSTLGLGLGDKPIEMLVHKMKRFNKPQFTRLQTLDVLVIDEVSMMSDELMEKASEILCHIRKNPKPFGGVQVVLAGDMCQLGPVSGKFCFLSSLWKDTIEEVCVLSTIVRQSGDDMFLKILHYLRKGKCTKKIFDKLMKCHNTQFPEGIKPTKLYSKRANVDKINDNEYNALVSAGAIETIYTTSATSSIPYKAEESMKWATQVGIPLQLKLCNGCQEIGRAHV